MNIFRLKSYIYVCNYFNIGMKLYAFSFRNLFNKSQIFNASPETVRFSDWNVGQIYQVKLIT